MSVDEIRNVYAQATDKNEMLRIEKEKKKNKMLEQKETNEQTAEETDTEQNQLSKFEDADKVEDAKEEKLAAKLAEAKKKIPPK